ncbi:MAG: hypothetical protein RR617_07890 [Anaerovoracaceae bacterium]
MKILNLKKIIIFLTSLFLILNSTLANTAAIRAWTVSNPMATGASILYDGLKGVIKSSVLITPNATQVAKVLGSGGGGFALSYAVEQLLGAVDWVLDPANNRIVYKVKTEDMSCSLSSLFCEYSYNPGFFQPVKRTAYQACQTIIEFYNSKQFEYKYEFVGLRIGQYYNYNGIQVPAALCDIKVADPTSRVFTDTLFPVSPNNPEFEEKTLSLETVAQEVIENAESDNLDAQFAVLAAANNILSEAEQDDAKAKPIEEDLERNSKKCPNGESRNIYGQCWICSAAEKQPIESNKNIAKVRAQALGSCVTGSRTKIFKNFDKDEFLVRATAWDTLADARDMENMCWLPKHPQHVEEAQINRKIAETCRAGAAQAIK